MKIKKSHVSLGLLVLIVSLSVVGVLHQSYKPQIKSETPKTSAGEIAIVTPENKTYTEPDSGYYPATYGFENDKNGFHPLGWDIIEGGGCSIEVMESLDGHQKVLQLSDGSTSNSVAYKSIDNLPYGTVEIWVRTSDASKELQVRFLNDATFIFQFQIQDNKFQYWDVSHQDIGVNASSDEWYHIKVDFESTGGNYSGLSQWKWQIYINNVLYGDYNYTANLIVNRLQLNTGSLESGYNIYFDAFGYTSDPGYTIGDNLDEGLLISYDNTTALDWQGYSLDGEMNRTILGNTTIPMPADGLHTIQMFGNDSIGTMYESNLRHFTVNTAPPEITINSPTTSQTIDTTAPSYDISITGLYDSIWYTLDDSITNITANSLTGTIDQSAWSALSDGIVTITFFANNSAGMEGSAQVMLIKDSSEEPSTPPPGIPGYNVIALVGVCCIVTLIIVKKKSGRIKS